MRYFMLRIGISILIAMSLFVIGGLLGLVIALVLFVVGVALSFHLRRLSRVARSRDES